MPGGAEGLAFKFYHNINLYFFDNASETFTQIYSSTALKAYVLCSLVYLGSGNLLYTFQTKKVVYYSATNSSVSTDLSASIPDYDMIVPPVGLISSAYFGCN